MNRRIFTALICLMLVAATVLVSCDFTGDNGEETTAATTAEATTAGTTAGAVAETTGTTPDATTGAPSAETTAAGTTAATVGATTAAGTTAATTVAGTTAATTTGAAAGTTAATTTAATTAKPVTDLKPNILSRNQNKPLARLDKPITVNVFPGDATYGDVTMDLQYQGWPTICASKDDANTIYAVSSVRIQHIDIFGAVGFSKSTDGGKTWTDMKIIVDTPLDDRDSGIVDLGNGHLMVTWFTHNASLYREGGEYAGYRKQCTKEQLAAVDAKLDTLSRTSTDSSDTAMGFSYVAHSLDGGVTWGDPIAIPVSLPHGATLMQDGKTLVCIGIPWNYKTVTGNNPASGVFYVYMSDDGGYTWKYKSYLSASEYGGYEAHIIQLTDGSFVASFRYDFADTGLRCYTATSKDAVRWTKPKLLETGFGGPPHLLQLRNGAVLLTYACRLKDQCEIRASISYDGGKTWGEEFVISRAVQQNTDHGYPSTVELADGTLITAYYQRYGGDDKYASTLYTKWALK